jgi:PAS domain S-box-containing protein
MQLNHSFAMADDELQRNIQNFQLLADHITDAFWIRSADMRTVHYVSPAFERIWGRPVNSLLANPDSWVQFIHPDDRHRVHATFLALTGSIATLDIEYRIFRLDGELRWIRVRGFQVRDDEGTLIRIIGIVTDITEQRRLAGELENERARLIAAQRVAKVGSWETDLRTMAVIWSLETHRIFETQPTEGSVTHQSFLERVHPEDRGAVDAAFLRSLDLDDQCTIEHRLLFPDGRVKFVEQRWQIARDEDGVAVKAVGTCQDISERKGAELELRASQQHLRGIIDGLGPSMFVALLTPEGILVDTNRALDASALNAEDVLGKPFDETQWWTWSPDVQQQLRDAILRAARGEPSRYDVRALGADGKFFDIDFSLQPLRDDDGRVAFLVASASVITERKQAEAALRQSHKLEAVGRLAAGVAHEFNNILQTLMAMATLARMRADTPESLKIASDMETQIRRGAAVTQQLLLSSRHQDLTRTTFDMREQVEHARDLLRRLIPENIALVVESTAERAMVEGDAGQIHQVLLNLVINARDAMPDGGTLALRVSRERGEVLLEVEDDGVGLDDATREHLFEPFFTTKEQGKGTGLGLAVVYGIVDQHGGRIEVVSRPGAGSVFRVILPEADPESTSAEMAPRAELSNANGRILLVEDEDGVREGLAALLETLGYDVVAVARGEEALALAPSLSPDLLLSDVSLPGISGPALAQRLRERWPHLRVTLMTGYIDNRTRDIAREESWFVLQKPFEFEQLQKQLSEILGT